MKSFSEQLSEVRRSRGITQERLAEMLGITRQGISNWERGKSFPDLDAIKQLSHILNYDFTVTEGITIEPAKTEPEKEETPGPVVVSADHPRKSALKHTAIGFFAGMLLTLLMTQYIIPLLIIPKPGYTVPKTYSSDARPDTAEWFQRKSAPVSGKPYVIISFSDNPVYVSKNSSFANGAGWNFTVYLTEYNGKTFYPESYMEYLFKDSSHAVTYEYASDKIRSWWEEDHIPARGQQCVASTYPAQDIIGIGIKLTGRDENGEVMSFYGYVECSQETR